VRDHRLKTSVWWPGGEGGPAHPTSTCRMGIRSVGTCRMGIKRILPTNQLKAPGQASQSRVALPQQHGSSWPRWWLLVR
uniref:Uncharacterized protein n=1 Tax=Varanus komodoensis TaxID=61221 RepID=A0A8D2JJF3_VARKO